MCFDLLAFSAHTIQLITNKNKNKKTPSIFSLRACLALKHI